MDEEEVKLHLGHSGLLWDGFRKWIVDQTVQSDKDGNTIFLTSDVKRYVEEEYDDLSFSGIVNLT